MVFLTDKAGEYYPYSIDKPEDFLTKRALERRERQGISINESDLPVNPDYVSRLDKEVDLYFTSKWMNAALIQADSADVADLIQFDFVDSVALIAEGSKLRQTLTPFEISDPFEDPPAVQVSSALQNAILQTDVMLEDGLDGSTMRIAVLDGGFRGVNRFVPFAHIWENNKVVGMKDFVGNSGNVFKYGEHGTSVLSTIVGKYQDLFVGTAPEAELILCVTEEGGSEDRVEEFNGLLGAEYADSLGADVINVSLGYKNFDIKEHNYRYEDLDGQTAVVSIAMSMAVKKGMVVVVSAGNDGDNPPTGWRHISPPADAIDVLSVGSINPDFSWTPFSSLGPAADGRIKPDVCAMGFGTAVVKGNGNIEIGFGTSYASPQIAGMAASLWQANPDWSNYEVMDALRQAGHQAHKPDSLLGYGVPSYAYINKGKVLDISDIIEERLSVYVNPFIGSILNLKVPDQLSSSMKLKVFDEEEKTLVKKTIKSSKKGKMIEFEVENLEEGLYYLSLQYDDQVKVVKLINL